MARSVAYFLVSAYPYTDTFFHIRSFRLVFFSSPLPSPADSIQKRLSTHLGTEMDLMASFALTETRIELKGFFSLYICTAKEKKKRTLNERKKLFPSLKFKTEPLIIFPCVYFFLLFLILLFHSWRILFDLLTDRFVAFVFFSWFKRGVKKQNKKKCDSKCLICIPIENSPAEKCCTKKSNNNNSSHTTL